jgi:magnesium chelatase family protein
MAGPPGESSAAVRDRVIEARSRQESRLGTGRCNADMGPGETRVHVRLDPEARAMLASGHERLHLSGRGYDRVLRVARTLADLAGRDSVATEHVARALTLRKRAGR